MAFVPGRWKRVAAYGDLFEALASSPMAMMAKQGWERATTLKAVTAPARLPQPGRVWTTSQQAAQIAAVACMTTILAIF